MTETLEMKQAEFQQFADEQNSKINGLLIQLDELSVYQDYACEVRTKQKEMYEDFSRCKTHKSKIEHLDRLAQLSFAIICVFAENNRRKLTENYLGKAAKAYETSYNLLQKKFSGIAIPKHHQIRLNRLARLEEFARGETQTIPVLSEKPFSHFKKFNDELKRNKVEREEGSAVQEDKNTPLLANSSQSVQSSWANFFRKASEWLETGARLAERTMPIFYRRTRF